MKKILLIILISFFNIALTADVDLKTLFKEDQGKRSGEKYQRTDTQRRDLVLQMLAEGKVTSPEDKFYVAMVLQHTGLKFVNDKLESISPENYLLGYYLAKSAYESGFKDARYLVPQAMDRYLSFTQGIQRYGTNRLINQETGIEELVPIDREVSDEERRKYGVATLKQLLSQYPEQKSK